MDYSKNVIARIKIFLGGREPKKDKEIYKLFGIGSTNYNKIMSGDLNINLSTLLQMSKFMGIPPAELLSDPKEKKQPVPDKLECVIENFSQLNPEELGEAMDSLTKTINFYRIGRERREAGEKPQAERSIAAGSIQDRDRLV